MASAPATQDRSQRFSATSADVVGLQISPDSQRVLYFVAPGVGPELEILSVPILGGPSSRLTPPAIGGHSVHAARFTPDSRRVLFTADLERDAAFELWSVSSHGRARQRVGPELVGGREVKEVKVSPDSRHAVFLADAEQDECFELYAAPLDGGAAVRLSLPISAAGRIGQFEIAPGGDRVVYLVTTGEAPQRFELYSVAIQGGESTRLNPPLLPGESVTTLQGISTFTITAAGRVLATISDGIPRRLFSVPVAGGDGLELSEPATRHVPRFEADSKGKSVFFIAEGADSRRRLLRVPAGGGSPVRVDSPEPLEFVGDFELAPDGSGLVYYTTRGDRFTSVVSVDASGGTRELVRSPDAQILGGRLVQDHVLVWRVQNGDLGVESLALDGTGTVELVSSAEQLGTTRVSPDSRRLVFVRPQAFGSGHELFSVDLESGVSVPLGPDPVAGGNVRQMWISPDSSRVVYVADQDVDEVFALYSVAIGGGAAVQLSPELVSRP